MNNNTKGLAFSRFSPFTEFLWIFCYSCLPYFYITAFSVSDISTNQYMLEYTLACLITFTKVINCLSFILFDNRLRKGIAATKYSVDALEFRFKTINVPVPYHYADIMMGVIGNLFLFYGGYVILAIAWLLSGVIESRMKILYNRMIQCAVKD